MIISDLLQTAFLPVERTGSQSLELLMKEKDPNLYRASHRHGKSEVPENYNFIISKRNPLTRLASYYKKTTLNDWMGYGKYFNTFEDFVKLINLYKYNSFFDNAESRLYAPHDKIMPGGELLQFPIPQKEFWKDMPTPTFIINHETYEQDIRNLPFVEESDLIPQYDGNDWNIDDYAFDGMEELANSYDWSE